MNHLQKLFYYQEKEVRVVFINDQPCFIAKDVCSILTINQSQTRRLDDDEKVLHNVQTLGGVQKVLCVNEAGLYSLILTSRKPEAKGFKRWITHEVLPSIRNTGTYSIHNSQEKLPMTYKQALTALLSEVEKNEQLQLLNEEQQQILNEQKPKVELYNTFMDSTNYLNMSQVAKSLGWGRNRLYAMLREEGILIDSKSVHMRNLPHQQYITQNYFKLIQVPVRDGDVAVMKNQTLVTPKGVEFIHKLVTKHELEQQFAQGYIQMQKEGIYNELAL